MPALYLVTAPGDFFGQTRKPWVSLDVNALLNRLQEHKYEVRRMGFDQLAAAAPTDAPVFYTFSQKAWLRRYIKDVITHVHNSGGWVIPGMDLLLCHENKGYQELLKQRMGIGGLWGCYVPGMAALHDMDIRYPVVLKEIEGSNAKGVHLVHSRRELDKRLQGIGGRLKHAERLDLFRRRHFRRIKSFAGYQHFDAAQDAAQYADYIRPDAAFVLQEFIPGLSCDYRVIILWDRYYVVRRDTRDGDFRASGAKKFVFEENVEPRLLQHAHDLFNRFGSPFLALDIGISGDRMVLFEFQGSHFGINAIVRAPGYYRRLADSWQFVPRQESFEQEVADGIVGYLAAHKRGG